jgi:putative inorganic carbon (hco3(-)) transporter
MLTHSDNEHSTHRRRRRRHRSDTPHQPSGPGVWAATLIIALAALALPLMMGNRTPGTLTASLLVLAAAAVLAATFASLPQRGVLEPPNRYWLAVIGLFSVVVLLQVLPIPTLAAAFGPYPEPLRNHPDLTLRHWSPDLGASLRGWAAFIALATVAWLAYSLRPAQRNILWLALAAMAVFQGVFGVSAHAAGADTIFGIWPRNNPGVVHGSFSNRNLFAAYMALLWPLAVAVWWIRGMPLLGRLPKELKVAGSLITSVIIGAALLASASRLGSAAAIAGVLVALVLWSRHRHILRGASVWPAYLALAGTLVAATWYGLTPLAERLLATDTDDYRFVVYGLMLTEFPTRWYLHGVGLGGFQAIFKQVQPGYISGWFDYAHNDLLQWLAEMGLVGAAMLAAVGAGLWRAAHLSVERIALYAGLAALAIVALGDFSWHIPATQIVLALYLGTLLRPADQDPHP